MMQLGTHLECIRSSPRVSRACQDGAMEFAGRRPRLIEKLSGIAEKLVGSWEGFQLDLLVMIIIVVSIVEGIRKLVGNTPGDFQKKIGRFIVRMSEATGLAGRRLDHPYPGNRMAASGYQQLNRPSQRLNCPYLVFEQLTVGKPPRLGG
ncbi:hypothetical protein BHM03_00012961 [Ensete ventricosum]|nr:hypothetical protein BHM03_00012961 [Ensete ventricosum]